MALVVGGKYVFGGGTIRPYVGGGAGVINLKRTVFETRIGDVTRAVFNDFELGEADLSSATEGINRPLVEVQFGVGIGIWPHALRHRLSLSHGVSAAVGRWTSPRSAAGIGYRF